jgi:hypothetical protein
MKYDARSVRELCDLSIIPASAYNHIWDAIRNICLEKPVRMAMLKGSVEVAASGDSKRLPSP